MNRLFDLPIVRKTTILRKGLALSMQPFASVQALISSIEQYTIRPPIFANSLPKSGTHLLLQITRALPDSRYLGRFIASSPSLTQNERSPQSLARKVQAVLPGETLGSHLYYSTEVEAALKAVNALHLFIYRDPRDVIVSEAFYLAEMNHWHRMHKYFSKLDGKKARLDLALNGLDFRYPDCNSRLLPYAGWLNSPNVLAIRYEDISGAKQAQEIERVATAYIQKYENNKGIDVLIAALSAAVQPEKSHTFREGGSGNWRRNLDDETADAVTKRLKPSLEAFGYME